MVTNILAQGHNRPPEDADPLADRLAEEHVALLARKRDLLDAEARLPLVIDEDSCGKVSDFVRQIQGCIKAAEQAHKTEKEPFLTAGRTVDAWLSSIKTPLAELKVRAERRVGTFLAAKEEAERKRREEEARQLAAQAREMAAEGDKAGAREVRAEARDLREEARNAKPADLVRTHTGMGGTATLKAPWVHEIIELAKVDLEKIRPYLPPAAIEQACRAFVRAGGRELAGVKIFQDRKASIR